LDNARPMVALLWQRETADKSFDSPERRAALDASLKRTLGLIEDPSIREHYKADFRQRRIELFAPKRANPTQDRGNWQKFQKGARGPARPTPSFRPDEPPPRNHRHGQ